MLGTLAQTYEDDTRNQRWLRGLSTINMLLAEFGYSLADRYEMMRMAGASFYEEFGIYQTLKRRIDTKYRNHRAAIVTTLQETNKSTGAGPVSHSIRAIRSLAPAVGTDRRLG